MLSLHAVYSVFALSWQLSVQITEQRVIQTWRAVLLDPGRQKAVRNLDPGQDRIRRRDRGLCRGFGGKEPVPGLNYRGRVRRNSFVGTNMLMVG